jgi:hypothetical protein
MGKCRKPCNECPFRRDNLLDSSDGKPGGADPTVYIGQAQGPFWLPCHKDNNYQGKASEPAQVTQCAGAAIYRANLELPYQLPDGLLKLDKDTDTVFGSPAELLAHYRGVTPEQAESELRITTPMELMLQEMAKLEVQQYDADQQNGMIR